MRRGGDQRYVLPALASVAALALGLPSPSAAQERLPDYSAIDQYFESLPAADGPRAPENSPGRQHPIDPALDRELAQADQGPALRRLASDPGLNPARRSGRDAGSADNAPPIDVPEGERSLASAVTSALFDTDGPGPVLLIGALGIAIGAFAARRMGSRAA